MSTFLYKGFTDEGNKVGGAKSFNSLSEMEKYVNSLNINRFEIFESKTNYSSKKYKLVNTNVLSIFCNQMSVVFFSFITLIEGVKMIAEQSDNKDLIIALNEIADFMDKGYTFGETVAMYDHIFGKYLIEMVMIGEVSGNLDVVFAELSTFFEKESKLRKKIKSAITYPIVLSIMMLAIIIFLIKSILPMFDSMLTSMGATQSTLTSSILGITQFFNTFGLGIIAVIIIIIVVLNFYFKTEKGRLVFDKLKVNLPGVKYVTTSIITTRFSRSLGILLRSGIQIVSALEQSSLLVDNTYLKERFVTAQEKVKNGENLAVALEEIGVFPKLFIKMLIVGNTTGNLDVVLDKSAKLFEDEVDTSIDRAVKLIEPILITILSLIVGAILLAIMIPMINIMEFI
ncbi:MAG: type II secretion system F family protein [Lachnospirales bacterium]